MVLTTGHVTRRDLRPAAVLDPITSADDVTDDVLITPTHHVTSHATARPGA